MQTSNNFAKGINQDIHPKYQPEGTYRYALNAVIETESGELPSISSEFGTYYCAINWPTSKTLIGHTLTDTDTIVLFFYDPESGRPEHEIGLYNPNTCEYTTIVADQFLNFSDLHPINALYRIRNGCDGFVYFTDNYNPYRVINITDTSDWVNPVFNTLIDASKILLSRPYTIPIVQAPTNPSNFVIDSGGQLEYGSYSFYIRYLDNDSNPTNEWIPLTNYIPIGRGLQSNQNTTLLGGASNVSSSPNFANKTNKSIRLGITALDTNFNYFQLAVVKRTSDSGAISGVDILFPAPIASSTEEFTYTGFSSQIFSSTSIDEILVPTQRIEKVAAHVIQDRRLYLGNNTFTTHDYSTYQRYASKLKVTYKATASDDRDAKDPQNYIFGMTLCPDEVYALGIVYIHDDGSTSPVFHIPGRPADIDFTDHTNPYIDSYTNWDTDDLTGDPNVFNDLKSQRWQVFSTASIDTNNSTELEHVGYLGYYQNPQTYPTIETCDEEDYWGEDWDGNALTDTNVRHHRMPNQWMYVGEDYASYGQYRITLELDNIDFPDSSVVGYYIVYGDRTEDRTVLDRGFIKPLSWDPTDEAYYYDYPDWDVMYLRYDASNNKNYSFVSPTTLFKQAGLGGDYISIEKRLLCAPTDKTDTNIIDVPEWDESITVNSNVYEYLQYKRPDRLNYVVVNSDTVTKHIGFVGNDATIQTGNSTFLQSTTGSRIENRSRSSSVGIYELEDYMVELDEVPFADDVDHVTDYTEFEFEAFIATAKSDRDVFTNLYTINYKKLSPYVHLTNNAPNQIVGGDMFMPYLEVLENYWNATETFTHLVSAQLVSDINNEFRYYSAIDRGIYTHYRYPGGYDHKLLANYISTKYYQDTVDISSFYPEYYELNPAYSYQNVDNVYLTIPFDYEFCNDCIESFPYRIYYSQLDNEEQQADNFRIILANNYSNIEGDSGYITDLFTAQDQIYLATTNALKRVPTKAQTLKSNENSIYIGTAEVLSLPLLDLTSVDYALGGLPNFKHRILTEYGVVYADPLSSRIFLVNNQLNDLSQNGLRNFFQENGRLFLNEQFKKYLGIDYPTLFTTPDHGIGYILSWDPRYKRVIVHKRDYEILPQYLALLEYSEDSTTPGAFWFDGSSFYENSPDEIPTSTEIFLGNSKYFANKSFTLSYSFITNSWISFHSYFPRYLFNNYKTFYSNGPNKHNSGPFQTYYNTKYPHIIDLVALQNPLDAKASTNVFYSSKAEEYDSSTKSYRQVDNTYDSFIAYNSYQSTGLQSLDLKDDYFEQDISNTLSRVAKVDSKYRVNNLRDLVIDNNQPIWTSNWNNIISQPYIDKIPNSANINLGASLFDQRRLRDHYLGLRFYFNPTQNYRILTDIISTLHDNKSR